MDLTKVLELLGANKLDESTQKDLSEKLTGIIEVKAKELSQETLEEQKAELVEHYEKKFDEYKEDITEKFSNFVDSVLEAEMTIPDEIVEFARKGQLYHDLIEQFKVRLGVDQGLLDEETKGILSEAKDEILKLRDESDKAIQENLELRSDAQELAATVYLYQKCEGLTESQRKKVFSILEGVKDKDEIDRKFDIIKESERFDPVEIGDDEGEKAIQKSKKKSDPKKREDEVMEGKGKAEVSEQDDEEEGDGEEDDEKKKKKNGNGNGEEEEMDESTNPFTTFKNHYLQVLKEGKIT